MAGIVSAQYADIANVEHCLPYSDGVVVALKSGHAWSLIETDGVSAGCPSEEGGAYRHKVDMTYHGHQSENTRALVEMASRRFLLKVTDSNGTEWLYGCMECPLRMTIESVNDGEPDGETDYRLSFSALCPLPELRIY